MKMAQNSSSKTKRSHTPNKTLFKYNCPPSHKSPSPNKPTTQPTQYQDFVEGYGAQSCNQLRAVSEIFTEKELARMGLFETVKKTKGEFYFKTIYQKSKYMQVHPSTDLSICMPQRKYFVYIVSGQFSVYKCADKNDKSCNIQPKITKYNMRQSNSGKCYIRSYAAHQHFGYQEYPLYWRQKLVIEAVVDSSVILFPLENFYKVFSNVINLVAIQLTAEFLRKVSVFRGVEMEKVLRIGTFAQRIRTYPNTLIAERGQRIENIVLLYDGRVSLKDGQNFYAQETSGFMIGKKQVDLKKGTYDHQIRALIQCDLIVIPLSQFSKVSQIKHKLRDSILQEDERNVKSRKKMYSNLNSYEKERKYSVTGYQTLEEQMFGRSMESLKQKKSNSLMLIDDPNESSERIELKSAKTAKYRPKTASCAVSMSNRDQKSVIYAQNGRQFFCSRGKTSVNSHQSSKFFNSSKSTKKTPQKQLSLENVTMGQIYWAKFLNRKSDLQNKQIAKIINARLPQSILNESKQYAVLKPLVQKKSTYIKNYKRKIKHAQKICDMGRLNESSEVDLKIGVGLRVEPPGSRVCVSSFMINSEDL